MSRRAAFGPTRLAALALGVVGLLAWIVCAVIAPQPAFQGWWTAFVFWSGPAFGALALLLIRRLVGGPWGEAFAPELEPAARAAPLVALFALPVVLFPQLVFHWAQAPREVEAQVRGFYLNPALFAVRQLAILVGLSLISLRLDRLEGPQGRLGAGLGLVFYGVAITFAATDWTLSLQASFTSSAAGMTLATEQLAGALAYAALQMRERPAKSPAGDLGALLFATALGLTYLAFMDYLVVWYGDRPEPDRWYLSRTETDWGLAALAALGFGFIVPSLLLILRHATGTRRALALCGASVLTGLLAFVVWEHMPAFGLAALAPGGLALVAQGGLFVAAAGGWPRLLQRREAAHAG